MDTTSKTSAIDTCSNSPVPGSVPNDEILSQNEQFTIAELEFVKGDRNFLEENHSKEDAIPDNEQQIHNTDEFYTNVDQQDPEGPNFTSIKPSERQDKNTVHQAPEDVDFSKL